MHTDKGIFQHQPFGNYYNTCELILIIFMNYATGSGLNVREEKPSFYSYMKAWQIILSIYSNAHPAHPCFTGNLCVCVYFWCPASSDCTEDNPDPLFTLWVSSIPL